MNIPNITARLYAIGAAILEKTGEKPWSAPTLEIADGHCFISLMQAYGRGIQDYLIARVKADTPEAALDAADTIIAALPSIETTRLHDHMARVADCIDKATADAIPDEYVTPLRMTVQAMTENLLAGPVAT